MDRIQHASCSNRDKDSFCDGGFLSLGRVHLERGENDPHGGFRGSVCLCGVAFRHLLGSSQVGPAHGAIALVNPGRGKVERSLRRPDLAYGDRLQLEIIPTRTSS